MKNIAKYLHLAAIIVSAIASAVAANFGVVDPWSAAALGAAANSVIAGADSLT